MMFGSNEGLRTLAMKVVHDLPKHASYVSYGSIAKLWYVFSLTAAFSESLCHLKLYSEGFGSLIAS